MLQILGNIGIITSKYAGQVGVCFVDLTGIVICLMATCIEVNLISL